MKKVIALVLVLVLVAACASCAGPGGTTAPSEASQSESGSAETGGAASGEAQGGEIVLKYWVTPAMANEADMQTPEDEWFIV